jgi:hypothetical protein
MLRAISVAVLHLALAAADPSFDLSDYMMDPKIEEEIMMDVDERGDTNYHFGKSGMSSLWELQMIIGSTSETWYEEGEEPLEVDASDMDRTGHMQEHHIHDGPLKDRRDALAHGLESLEERLQRKIDSLDHVIDPHRYAVPFGSPHRKEDEAFFYTIYNTPAPETTAFTVGLNMRTHKPGDPNRLVVFLSNLMQSVQEYLATPAGEEPVQKNLREHNGESRPSSLVKFWESLEKRKLENSRVFPTPAKNLREHNA